MCSLCSNDPKEREQAIKAHYRIAEDLEKLAANYRDMAAGRVKLHVGDNTMKTISSRARQLIVELVNEYV